MIGQETGSAIVGRSYIAEPDGDKMLGYLEEAQLNVDRCLKMVADMMHKRPSNPIVLLQAMGRMVKPLLTALDNLRRAEALRQANSKRRRKRPLGKIEEKAKGN